MSYSILLAGVGGQGVLLASTVIGNAAIEQDMNVVMSEVHGMAQRGGSVAATVRIGENVRSPLIEKGGADVVLGFEPAETYRCLPFANRGTDIVTNVRPVIPVQVSLGLEKYPDIEEMLDAIRQVNDHLLPIDADALAVKAGSRMAASSVLIGVICTLEDFPIPRKTLVRALLQRVPERYAEVNERAFAMGYEETRARVPEHQIEGNSTRL